MIKKEYIRTKEHRDRHSKLMKEWHKDNEHPRGMLGKKAWNKNKKCVYAIGNKHAKGNKPNKTSFKKGKQNINYGRTTPTIKGEKHWNWKGGVTPELMLLRNSAKYQIWRNAVYLRDDFICQECGLKGMYLHAHHIKPFASYPELRFKIENGQTLCKNCHAQLHARLRNILITSKK